MNKCQCEQIVCDHKQTCCHRNATQTVKTIYGTYEMCDQCSRALPTCYLKLEKAA